MERYNYTLGWGAQAQLARRADVRAPQLSRWFSTGRGIGRRSAQRLEGATGVSAHVWMWDRPETALKALWEKQWPGVERRTVEDPIGHETPAT
jgi:plasmid maintenance system antidote protein VapI